jgi:hypothetical protein
MPGNKSTFSRVRLPCSSSSVHVKLLGLLSCHAHICTRKHWHEYVPCKRMDQGILRKHGTYWMLFHINCGRTDAEQAEADLAATTGVLWRTRLYTQKLEGFLGSKNRHEWEL